METSIWAGVRERVLQLAGAPGADAVFGHNGHGFALADRLIPEELAELEAWLGMRLPEEYRAFLLEVGAGGAGPSYGVFPVVREPDGSWRWHGDGAEMTSRARIREPFPAQCRDPEALAVLLEEEPLEEDHADIEAFDRALSAWGERVEDLLWTEDRTVGAVCLCHLGCAERQWLVVSGPEAGRMWNDPRADDEDLRPLTGDEGGPVTFAQWYLEWLDQASAQVAASRP